jgi:hypothetical protein
VSLKTFDVLIDSLGVFGVAGLDRFYGFSVVKDLQIWVFKIKVVRISLTLTPLNVPNLSPITKHQPLTLNILALNLAELRNPNLLTVVSVIA